MKKFLATLCIIASIFLAFFALSSRPSQATTTTTTSIYGVPIGDTLSKVIAKVSSQTITSNASSFTKAQLATEVLDTRGEFSTSTYKFTAISPGLYLCGAIVKFPANADNATREFAIYLNGAATGIGQCTLAAGAANATILSGGGPLVLAAGDYVELYVRQASGSSLALDSGTELSIVRL